MPRLNRLFLLIFLLSAISFSCDTPKNQAGRFLLLPSPQQFDITGVSNFRSNEALFHDAKDSLLLPKVGSVLKNLQTVNDPNKVNISWSIDPEMEIHKEGYQLFVKKDKIDIKVKGKVGLLYAFMTLDQLWEDAADQDVNLPLCTIKDEPKLAYRAIHLDVKHHREKLTYYYKLIDRLAKYKVNAIIAEVEDKLKYKRRPLIGSEDALSIEEWSELTTYANDRNIEISPLVQGLGHASFVLKHNKYNSLRDDPNSDWAFNPLDPKTYELQFDLYLDAIEATPNGKYLHIGGDEVHTTGRGSGQSSLELQLIWLNKVCKFAADHNRIPIFWDDMPLKQTGVYRPMFDTEISSKKVDSIWNENEHRLLNFIDEFPKNCVYMRWNYQTPETYGNLKAMDWFAKNGFDVMGATAGQTRWTLMPQNQSNIPSIRSFASSSIDKNLNGLLLTLWDDDSPHFELYMRGIMAFAEYTWAGNKQDISNLKKMHLQRAFGSKVLEEDLHFIDLLEKPVAFWKNALLKKRINRQNLMQMDSAMEKGIIDLPDPQKKGEWAKKYANRLVEAKKMLKLGDSLSQIIDKSIEIADRNQYTLDVYKQVNLLSKFSAEILIILENYDLSSADLDEKLARQELTELKNKFLEVRSNLEEVYSKTRLLNKPDNYILDQDHHRHPANQSINFDWQFIGELLLLDKLSSF